MDFYSCDICKELIDGEDINLCEICESRFCNACKEYLGGNCKKCYGKINLTK